MTIEQLKQDMLRVKNDLDYDIKEAKKQYPIGQHPLVEFLTGYYSCLTEYLNFIENGDKLKLSEKLDKAIIEQKKLNKKIIK